MLCSLSWAGRRLTWDAFNQINERTPLLSPKLRLPYPGAAGARSAVNQLPKSVGAGNPHATFCGNRGRVTASGDPVGVKTGTTGDLVRHRQTKGAATDMVDLKPPASHSDSTQAWSERIGVRKSLVAVARKVAMLPLRDVAHRVGAGSNTSTAAE
jgi:hypothetical protein